MEDRDLRLDVPARAYINAQLLSLLERGGTLLDAKKYLFSRAPYLDKGLDPYGYHVHDHSLLISLLFCTIVVPREFLDLPANHEIYRDFDAEDSLKQFSVRSPKSFDAYMFLRLLRNSVAHGLFSIRPEDSNLRYSFWTERDPVLDASICHDGLLRFLTAVGQRLCNAVLSRKRGEGGEGRVT